MTMQERSSNNLKGGACKNEKFNNELIYYQPKSMFTSNVSQLTFLILNISLC